MNKKETTITKLIDTFLLVLLFTASMSTLFLFPSSAYALKPTVCWDCFDWGYGEECGMDFHGSTGCTHAGGKCELTGVACNI